MPRVPVRSEPRFRRAIAALLWLCASLFVPLLVIARDTQIYSGSAAAWLWPALLVILLGLAHFRLARASMFGALPLAAAILLVFSYGWMEDHSRWFQPFLFGPFSFRRAALLVMGAGILLAFWIRRSERLSLPFAVLLILFAGTGLAISLATALFFQPGNGRPESGVPRPNIHVIILDSYPHPDYAASEFGVNRALLDTPMAEMGFRPLGKALSNYSQTHYTVGAMMTLDHVVQGNRANLYPAIVQAQAPPPLLERLQGLGYQVHATQSAAFVCRYRHMRCLVARSAASGRTFLMNALAQSPVRNMRRVLQAGHATDGLATLEDHLPRLLAGKRPTFVLTHHLPPHPPYLHDEHCRRSSQLPISNGWQQQDKARYALAIRCTNLELVRTLRKLVTADPGALILVLGDHGPYFKLAKLKDRPVAEWPADGIRERMSFINLVRLPEACQAQAPERPGQINSMRLLLACAEGTRPDWVRESSFISSYGDSRVRDVTGLADHP